MALNVRRWCRVAARVASIDRALSTPFLQGFADAQQNVNPNTGVQAGPSNFYNTYCANKRASVLSPRVR